MEVVNYYDLYTKGLITLTDGYAKSWEMLLNLQMDIDDEDDVVEMAAFRLALESIDHEGAREFFETQVDLFAQRIAHNFMLANDYTYGRWFL